MCVVYDGYTKAEACIAGEALDLKSVCDARWVEITQSSKFTVVDNGEIVESSCRLGAGSTHLDA